ncbi:MAG: ATP-dependent protease subunit HslV [Planctomycetota bacterium]|nr:ATP-dependent protease subunit HslV [Planctomycetota bacterium]
MCDKTGAVRGTTILTVRRDGKVAMAGDGQVTQGAVILKAAARKVRKMRDGEVLVGFSGATADAMSLLERLEKRLEEYKGSVRRAAVELAKEWRTDRVLRRLDAQVLVCDRDATLLVSGLGDVLEPDDGCAAIGSGGPFALAAARALLRNTDLPARAIVEKAMEITAEICVYTNSRFVFEEIP